MLTLNIGMVLFGCSWFDKKDDSFSALGETTVDLSQYQQGGQNNDDTDFDSASLFETGLNTDAPVITGLSTFFNSYQGIGDVIELHVNYEDPQDDLLNGVVLVTYGGTAEEIPIDNTSAVLETGEITVLFDSVDTSTTYTFTVSLRDASGNESEEVQSIVEPVDEE
jgi:hypothetical protein